MSSPPTIDLPRGFEDLRGRTFNQRYAVSEILTVGRSHVVFGATDRKGAGLVLLRVMRPSLLHDPPTVERFKQRVQNARRASSLRARPSIDAGEAKDGKLFLVCKRPAGRSLRQYVLEHEARRLPWPVAKKLLLGLVEVLSAAHDRRLVHGGMMPDSFWIEEPEGSEPVAYVVDLGANSEVRLEDETVVPLRTTALTADMEFTAPETIESATYDPRTDVYLLGLIAYFMLAGRPPFSGKNQFQVASLQLQQAVPPLRGVVPGVPEGVEALVGRMLAKSAAERPQTMKEVGRELVGLSELTMAEARGHAVAQFVPPVEPLPSWSFVGAVPSLGRPEIAQTVAPPSVVGPSLMHSALPRPPHLEPVVTLAASEVMERLHRPREPKPTEVLHAHPTAPSVECPPVAVPGSRGGASTDDATAIFAARPPEAGASAYPPRRRVGGSVPRAPGGARLVLEGTEILEARGSAPRMESADRTVMLGAIGDTPFDAAATPAPSKPDDYLPMCSASMAPLSAESTPPEAVIVSPWPMQGSYSRSAQDEPSAPTPSVSCLPRQVRPALPASPGQSNLTIPIMWILIAVGTMIACGVVVGIWLAR